MREDAHIEQSGGSPEAPASAPLPTSFVVPRWRVGWLIAALGCAGTTYFIGVPFTPDFVMYAVALFCLSQFVFEMHGVRVGTASLRAPVRPSPDAPMISRGLRTVALTELSRVTIITSLDGRRHITLRTNSGDTPIYFSSEEQRRSFLRLMSKRRPDLSIRKKR